MIKEDITSFERLFNEYDIVFNCTGLGAQQLTNDSELEPMSGQAIRVDTGDKARNTFTYIHTGTTIVPYYYWT